MRNVSLAVCRGASLLLALVLGGCPSTQSTAPPPASSMADPKREPPAPMASAVPETGPSPAPAASGEPTRPNGGAIKWTFDTDRADTPPSGFSFGKTGSGKPGQWVVRAAADAPSAPNVLAQIDADSTDYRFPVAVANEPLLRDVRLSVRCKPVSGKVDQACGLVFRYRDQDNYYVTRANALENNVRLYHVVKGDRRQFAGWNGTVSSGAWHSLRVEAKGDHLEVYWDEKKVMDAHDGTFSDAGKVGLWTKADSVTFFDDLSASPN
jgi:hypothetical protein